MEDYLVNLSPSRDSDYSLWKTTKHLKQPTIPASPLKVEGRIWVKSDHDKTDVRVFANHLKDQFTCHKIASDVTPDISLSVEDQIPYFTTREVATALDRLNPKKAPGVDKITAPMLKELPKKGIVMATYVFNTILRLHHITECWKTAKIIMIAKDGKPLEEPSSYRPISLLPAGSKLFERLFLARLNPVIETSNLIPNFQFGFRSKHSTIEQVHRVASVIDEALEHEKFCSAIFPDTGLFLKRQS